MQNTWIESALPLNGENCNLQRKDCEKKRGTEGEGNASRYFQSADLSLALTVLSFHRHLGENYSFV